MHTSVGEMVLGSLTFPRMSCLYVFFNFRVLIAAVLCGARAKHEKETAARANDNISHDASDRRPSRPGEQPDERASYLRSLHSRQAV